MKWWQYLVFVVIVFFIFCVYAITRETVIDADTPAYLMYSCNKTPIGHGGDAIGTALSVEIFKIMPCNMLFFKGIACFLLLLSTLVLAKCGELFNKKIGWLAGLFAFNNPWWIIYQIKLEEMNFAYPIIFLGFYFLMKKQYIKSLITIGIAGIFWRGSIYYFLLPGLYWFPFTPIAFYIILIYWNELTAPIIDGINNLIPGILGKEVIAENIVAFGIIIQFALFFGIKKIPKYLWPATAFTMLIAFLSAKYSLFATPFLTIGCILLAEKDEEKLVSLTIIPIGLIIFSAYLIPTNFPTNETINQIKTIIDLADENVILNDWGLGWWIKYYGGKTNNYSGQDFPDYNNWKGYAITNKDTNCVPLSPVVPGHLKILSCQ